MQSIYPWQMEKWQQLTQQVTQGWLAHALMLCGQAGIGKADFARQLAAFLLCEQRGEQACGQCRSCLWLKADNHPDFFALAPEGSKYIKVDQVRELIAWANETAHCEGGNKVILLSPVEAMNTAAANALLKTLEEPADGLYFLLVCHQRMMVPATILSRCQLLHFLIPDPEPAMAWLSQQVPGVDVNVAWRLACGAPLVAASYLASDTMAERDRVLDHMGLIYQRRQNPLQGIAALQKQSVAQLLLWMQTLAFDILQLKLGVAAASLMHQDQLVKLQYLAKQVPLHGLLAWQKDLKVASQSIRLNPQLNVELFLEALFLRWAELGRVV
jgi:DNA polymerase-3 subunit delta'